MHKTGTRYIYSNSNTIYIYMVLTDVYAAHTFIAYWRQFFVTTITFKKKKKKNEVRADLYININISLFFALRILSLCSICMHSRLCFQIITNRACSRNNARLNLIFHWPIDSVLSLEFRFGCKANEVFLHCVRSCTQNTLLIRLQIQFSTNNKQFSFFIFSDVLSFDLVLCVIYFNGIFHSIPILLILLNIFQSNMNFLS